MRRYKSKTPTLYTGNALIIPNKNVPQYGWGGAGKGALTGAGTGASLGAAIGSIFPGYGTLIGGAIGAVAGGIAGGVGGHYAEESKINKLNRERALALREQQNVRLMQDRQALGQYNVGGIGSSLYMKYGGSIPRYSLGGTGGFNTDSAVAAASGLVNSGFEFASMAEPTPEELAAARQSKQGGFVMRYGGKVPKMEVGGMSIPTSSNTDYISGDTHNQDTNRDGMTGVTLQDNNGQPIAEVENGEVVRNTPNDFKVYSDKLRTPRGRTYAEEATIISKSKGKIEAKARKLKNVMGDAISANTGQRYAEQAGALDMSLEQLFEEQESMKGQNMQQPQMRYGGKIPKYAWGGGGGDTGTEFITYDEYGNPITANRKYKPVANVTPENNSITVDDFSNIFDNPNETSTTKFISYDENGNPITANRKYAPSPKGLPTVETMGTEKLPSSSFDMNLRSLPSNPSDPSDPGTNSLKNINIGRYINGITPYIDNIANAAITAKQPKAWSPILTPISGLSTTYNAVPQIESTRRLYRGAAKDMGDTTSNSATYRANLLALKAGEANALNQVYGNKENIENQLKNDAAKTMYSVAANNNAQLNNYRDRQMMRELGINKEISDNIAGAVTDKQMQTREANQMKLDKEELQIYSRYANRYGVLGAKYGSNNTISQLADSDKDFAKYLIQDAINSGSNDTETQAMIKRLETKHGKDFYK